MTHDKTLVAASSVFAAIFLTSLKIAVGLLTGSLGILSEAAHSSLDLVAAAVTFAAVRIGDRPADRNHHYGHGKIENLSALIEAALLSVTCVFIIYEALQRLFVRPVEVDASPWAFGILLVSIAIDFSRSRALQKMAAKYHSQALEADALHFSTDIWSSIVVIAGLLLVKLGELTNQAWLNRADAVAALGVALIVTGVSVRLGKRAVDILLDTAPRQLAAEIRQSALKVAGVLDARQVRMRRVGPTTFVDMSIAVERASTFDESHQIASQVESAVQRTLPGSDVLVHVDPIAAPDESLMDTVRGLAAQHGLEVHSVRAERLRRQLFIEFHVEVDDALNLQEAHALVSHLEDEIKRALPNVAEVTSHIEPAGPQGTREALPENALESARRQVERIARAECGSNGYHHVDVRSVNGKLDIVLHVFLDDQSPIREAHDLSTQLEAELRRQIANVGEVLVHVEPRSMAAQR